MLECRHVKKSYGEKLALDDFSLQMGRGVYGLLGENGAGKSTLIRMLTCNLQQSAGEILWEGKDVRKMGQEYRACLGYLPQESVGYPRMRVGEFVEYMAALKGVRCSRKQLRGQIMDALARVHLENEVRTRFYQLSGGMKRRLLLAQAILGEPSILILDEPTAGLDPHERIAMRNLIAVEAMEKTVLLATHIISDIDCVADHIILMKEGKNLGCRRPEEWLDALRGKVWETVCDPSEAGEMQKRYQVTAMRQCREGVRLRILSEQSMDLARWQSCEPTLDEVYLYDMQ